MPAARYWARQYWPDLLEAATATDPKEALELELFALLDGEPGITWPVYNTTASGSAFAYVVFQAAGGNDDHMKKRGFTYEYQVVGIHTDRATALDMGAAIEAAMATAKAAMSVTGFAVIWADRVGPVDYTQRLDDGTVVHHVGGIYEIRLREV